LARHEDSIDQNRRKRRILSDGTNEGEGSAEEGGGQETSRQETGRQEDRRQETGCEENCSQETGR
jgi:hypothetical protein